MILTNRHLSYLVGGREEDNRPAPPFCDIRVEFLSALSKCISQKGHLIRHPDVLTFAFWCRKANITRLRDTFDDGRAHLGLGAVFHVSPSNVPINFAFSYVFGFLAGNSNYVRLPSHKFPQVDIISSALNAVLELPDFTSLKATTHFFRYNHEAEITAEISAKCQGRVIWGGREAIEEVRKYPIQIRGREIGFADRYSFCVLGARTLVEMSRSEMERLALGFYNDTYLMDQNACSSPHLVVWLGDLKNVLEAKARFWDCLLLVARRKYEISTKAVVDKLTLVYQSAIELREIGRVHIHNSLLFRVELEAIPDRLDLLRGNCGYFYEFTVQTLDKIAHIVNSSYQTLTYAGVNRSQLLDFVIENRLSGIDRIVPVGTALDIGVVWDGHHMIQSLSRIIEVR